MDIFNNNYSNNITIPILNLDTKLWDLKYREKNKNWLKLSFVKYEDAIEFYTAAIYYLYFKEIKKTYNIDNQETKQK